MKASFYHLQVNVDEPAVMLPFYKELFGYFDYEVVDESPEHLGVTDGSCSFWFIATDAQHLQVPFHRRRAGLNHIAFRVERREDVDRFVEEFAAPRQLTLLYGSPQPWTDYSPTYYAAFFETPDRLKIEVAFP